MKKGLAADIVLLASLEERFVAISFLSTRDGPDGRGGLYAYLDLLSTIKEKMYFLSEGAVEMKREGERGREKTFFSSFLFLVSFALFLVQTMRRCRNIAWNPSAPRHPPLPPPLSLPVPLSLSPLPPPLSPLLSLLSPPRHLPLRFSTTPLNSAATSSTPSSTPSSNSWASSASSATNYLVSLRSLCFGRLWKMTCHSI